MDCQELLREQKTLSVQKFAVDDRLPIDPTFEFFINTLGSLTPRVSGLYVRGHRQSDVHDAATRKKHWTCGVRPYRSASQNDTICIPYRTTYLDHNP